MNAQPSENSGLKAAAALLGIVGATAGLVYATGGIVLGLRLFVHHFSYGPVIGQLPRQFLLSFGLSEVILPALAVAGLYAAWRLLRGYVTTPKGWSHRWAAQSSNGERRRSVGLVLALALILVAPAAVFTAVHWDWRRCIPLVVGFVVAVVISAVMLELRALLGKVADEGKRSKLAATALMVVIVAIWSMPGFVLLWGNIDLPAALLCSTTGRSYAGVLIGETSDRTYIGENPIPRETDKTNGEAHHQILAVPLAQVRKLFFGHQATTLSCRSPLVRR